MHSLCGFQNHNAQSRKKYRMIEKNQFTTYINMKFNTVDSNGEIVVAINLKPFFP